MLIEISGITGLPNSGGYRVIEWPWKVITLERIKLSFGKDVITKGKYIAKVV